MYSTLLSSALIAATAVPGIFATFSIETTQLTQCQDATISWSPGIPPYYLVVVNANDPCGDPVLDLGTMSGTSFVWNVAVPSGAPVELYLEDSGPDDAWSGRVPISKSDDSSCLSQSVLSYYNMTKHTPTSSSAASPSTNPSSNQDTTHAPSPSPSPSNTGLVPIGAANAGTNPLSSGTPPMHRGGAPIATIFVTFAAAIALAL